MNCVPADKHDLREDKFDERERPLDMGTRDSLLEVHSVCAELGRASRSAGLLIAGNEEIAYNQSFVTRDRFVVRRRNSRKAHTGYTCCESPTKECKLANSRKLEAF